MLSVEKIKYNKKVYKVIIYTILVLNIISFGVFPKSQSKFKDEKLNAYVYSASLYALKNWEVEEKTDTVEITSIKLIEDDSQYISDMKNAFFEYSIQSEEYTLHYEEINKTIQFKWETVNPINNQIYGEGTCNVIHYQKSKDNKGIVLCKTLQDDKDYFGKYGIKLTITAQDSDEKLDYNEYKKIITNLTIEGEKSYGAGEYQSIVNNSKDYTKLIIFNPYDCNTFNQWLIDYDLEYYAPRAFESYKNDLKENVGTASIFDFRTEIEKYISKHVDSSSCNLMNLNIPGISYEEIAYEVEGSSSTILRYVYTIEDNFIGYARTYTQEDTTVKKMYFTTKDGRSFTKENDNKWQDIFEEYLDYFVTLGYYSAADASEIVDYLNNKNADGILHILKQTGVSDIKGIEHLFQTGEVILNTSIIDDYIYNLNHKEEGKLRVSILGTNIQSKTNMYQIFKENLDTLYGEKYASETLESLWSLAKDNVNLAKGDEIYDAIISSSLDENGVYIDNITGLGTDTGKTFTAHIYSDGTYNWFEILPAGTRMDENTTTYTLKPSNFAASLTQSDYILSQIQMLDAYYNIDERTEINNDITYLFDENEELVGYIQVELDYDSESVVKKVNYTAYIGEFDTEVIKSQTDTEKSSNATNQELQKGYTPQNIPLKKESTLLKQNNIQK